MFLAPGAHKLTCSFIGMESMSKEFNLVDGENVRWDISLETTSKVLDMAVVSAGRFEQSVAEVTVSLEVLKQLL